MLVEAALGDTPVVVAAGMLDDTELALCSSDVCVLAVGELDAAAAAESYAPATGLAEEVDMDEDVAGAPNALAVGMSASVREAADTPNS